MDQLCDRNYRPSGFGTTPPINIFLRLSAKTWKADIAQRFSRPTEISSTIVVTTAGGYLASSPSPITARAAWAAGRAPGLVYTVATSSPAAPGRRAVNQSSIWVVESTWSSCSPFGNTVSSCRFSASHTAYLVAGYRVQALLDQLLDQLGAGGLVLDQYDTGFEGRALLAYRALQFGIFHALAQHVRQVRVLALDGPHPNPPSLAGAEIPDDAGGLACAAGFMIATDILHLAGIRADFLIGTSDRRLVRLTGGLTTVPGGALLAGIL